jgi:hypothetical protein
MSTPRLSVCLIPTVLLTIHLSALLFSVCTTGGDTGVSEGIETADSCTMHRGKMEDSAGRIR